MSRNLRKHLRSSDGAAAVEFALVAMFLVVLLTGIAQFAFIFEQWLQIEHAAREGVRWASLCNPAPVITARTIAASPGVNLTAANIQISPADPPSAPPGSTAQVTVTHSVPVFVPLMSQFLGGQVNLTATARQLLEK